MIHLHLRFHPVVLVFIGVWMGGFGLAALGVTYASITSNVINPMMFAPIGMFLFRCVPTMGGFLNDCRRMLDELRRSLSAEGFEPIRSS